MRTWKGKIAAVALLGVSMGCGTELGGEEGNLSFRYLGADLIGGISDGTLAVGSKIDVEVREAEGGETGLPIESAVSEDDAVLSIADLTARQFTLEARTAGESRISVTAAVGEESVSDSVTIRSADAGAIVFSSLCEDDLFVTDSGALFGYRMNDANGRKLTGYGYYPVSVDPPDAGTVREDHKELDRLRIDTGSEPGTYRVVSDLDESFLEFQLVSPEEISSVSINREEDDLAGFIEVGSELGVALVTMEADGKSVCGPARAAIELTTSTPEICEPSYRFLGALHLIFVEGLAEGECVVNLNVADTSLEREFTIEVR